MEYVNKVGYEHFKDDEGFDRVRLSTRLSQTLPDTLNKFYALNENAVNALENESIWVSYPDQFNDIFDGLYDRINLPLNAYRIREIWENSGESEEFIQKELNQFQNDPSLYQTENNNTLFALWSNAMGLISMTDQSVNDLMWSHYANNTGFLGEFNYSKWTPNFTGPYSINYLENKDFVSLKINDIWLQMMTSVLVKKEVWKYENEYRFIVYPSRLKSFETGGRFSNMSIEGDRENRIQKYPKESIKGVTLGFKFFEHFEFKLVGSRRYDIHLMNNSYGNLKNRLLLKILSLKCKTLILSFKKADMEFKQEEIIITRIAKFQYTLEYKDKFI